MTKIFYSFIVVCFFLCISLSCNNEKKGKSENEISANPPTKDLITIDLDTTITKNFQYSNLFKSFKIIPLETNEFCMLGRIKNIFNCNDTLFLCDGMAKSVFLFTSDGKFIREIGSTGKGPGEYIEPSKIKLDKKNRHLFIYDKRLKKILKYGFNDEFISEVSLNKKWWSSDFTFIDENTFFIDVIQYRKSQNNCVLRKINKKGLINEFLFTPQYGKSWEQHIENRYNFFPFQNETRFFKPYLDTVYTIKKDNVVPYLCLKSDNLLTNEDVKNIQEKQAKESSGFSISMLSDKVAGIEHFVETPIAIYFEFCMNKALHSVIYNKYTKSYKISGVRYEIDDLAYSPKIGPRFLGNKNNELIKIIEPRYIERFINTLEENNIPLTGEFAKLQNLNSQSNPVLIFYEIKEKWN